MRKKCLNALLSEGEALALNQRMPCDNCRQPSDRESPASTHYARCTAVLWRSMDLFLQITRLNERRPPSAGAICAMVTHISVKYTEPPAAFDYLFIIPVECPGCQHCNPT